MEVMFYFGKYRKQVGIYSRVINYWSMSGKIVTKDKMHKKLHTNLP